VAKFSALTDNELIGLFKSGEDAAYTELYERYHDSIYRFLRKYLRSAALSEDICQNVFLKLWERRDDAVTILEFGAYLFTLAKRQAFDFLKRATIEENAMGIILQGYRPNLNVVEDSHEARDYMRFIEDVLDRLPEQSKAVFRLCRQQHKTYEEAAATLGISKHLVKKQMVRSMKVLKDAAESELGISFLVLLALLTNRP
jgi:RNA polymerase sigma-70 factor (family 1)